MVRRFVALLAAIWLLAAPLAAQRVEVSFGAGYTASEGVTVNDLPILGVIYNQADIKSGGSFNFTFGVNVTPKAQIEFLYGRQSSKLGASGGGISTDVAELAVNNYHFNFVYNWGEDDARLRPFALVGAGMTNYSGGNLLLPGAAGSIGSETQFSTTWGAGVKFYPAPNFGLKLTARWTPTYIKSTSAGYWCDPFYGCWLMGDPDYSHQFDISGGITFRF